jgi:CRISPR-associated protein Csm3
MKLKKIIKFEGIIHCLSGIAIRGVNNELSIGGADSEVIKNPLTGEPYIPGSSLKGKLRSQLEKKYGMKDKYKNPIQDKPCGCGDIACKTCVVFGAHMNPGAFSAPTRVSVRDGKLTKGCKTYIESLPAEKGSYLEIKAENLIKRNTGTADAPRFMERVPEGAEFTLEIVLQIFENDKEDDLIRYIIEGLKLVELSSLGGSGSRGYGKVEFDYRITSHDIAEQDIPVTDITSTYISK